LVIVRLARRRKEIAGMDVYKKMKNISLSRYPTKSILSGSKRNQKEVEAAAKRALEVLYGPDIKDMKVMVLLPFPNEHNREAWDANVTFILNDMQYTVDLLINEGDGQVTNARLIDTMAPL
jgi:hypothetical protein